MIGRALAILIAAAFLFVGYQGFRFLSAGPGRADEIVIFELPGGKPFATVAQELEAKGLILDPYRLRILARLTGSDKRVKVGEYELNRAMTPQQIMSVLVSGRSIMYPVTFPEGSNIFEMAALLESKGLYKAEEFLKAARDKDLIQKLLGIDVSSLEGYLFPETYNLTKFTPLSGFLALMVQNFKNAYTAIEGDVTAPVSLARHERVILASVVEKETGAPEERPMIASVFYNRLQKNMRLQSDPTIVYGIWVDSGSYKQNITKADILAPTRYNTYTVARLPFGPIANPGRESLAAVLKPAKSEFLYFVSRNDGTHIFSKTYEEHNKAVQSFQLNPSAREGRSWRDLKKRPPAAAAPGR
ncbi:MAG TPA: endolytic transglycosylase MltG [Bdellovibrionales bacterium]|nr:endolytic transglycosylase MltG [Bdellovibrionales bacterium]